MMSYIVAILVLVIFSVIYVIGYMLNSKISIDCDRNVCDGCPIDRCSNRIKEEGK